MIRTLKQRLSPILCSLTLVLGSSTVALAKRGGRPADFSLPAAPGSPTKGRFKLSKHLGKDPVVILFWATWCAPCRQELAFYEKLYQRYKSRGLKVVAISMDGSNTIASVGPTARKLGLTFPVLSDLESAATGRLNPRRAAPFSIWIDRDGHIVREWEGFSLSERKVVATGVAKLVK